MILRLGTKAAVDDMWRRVGTGRRYYADRPARNRSPRGACHDSAVNVAVSRCV
ncbi:MAG: hypothetical protein JWO57_1355 [Pseudonocardiales bacterium]|nr:hypothetical protein [Pseudonocardiales bacterium]